MRITPLDIQKHRFRRRLFGVDPDEVKAFLAAVSEQFESVVRDNASYREQIANLKEALRLHEEREKVLKETLIAAQRAADETRENARKDASLIVEEAEIKAERMVDLTTRRISEMESQVTELRTARRRLRERLLVMWEEQKALVEGWLEEDERDKLEFMTPRKNEQTG